MGSIVTTIQFIIVDFVVDLLRWPVWWYSKGFLLVAGWGWQSVKNYGKSLALGVWIKNIFVPMYGARDFQSRLISLLVRVVQIIARGFLLVFFTIMIMAVVSVYTALPVLCVIGIVLQFTTNFD